MAEEYTEIEIPSEHHALLEKEYVGMLTTLRRDNMPSTNPVGFVWDGKHIQISTLKSRVKYKSLLNNPKVAFCVMDSKDMTKYLEVRGYASLEDDPNKELVKQQFLKMMGEEPPVNLDPPNAERVTITIHATQISSPTLYGGRFDK